VEAACIEMYVNGKYAGTAFWEPFIFEVRDLLKEANNKIEAVVSTTLFNLMGPNYICDIFERKSIYPDTFRQLEYFTEHSRLLPFGIGSMSLITYE
jgi:hypothetical protein